MVFNIRFQIFFYLGLTLLLSTCRNIDEYRADFDESVGSVSTNQYSASIQNGLGAITSSTENQITIFASAPNLDFQINLQATATAQFTLNIFNIMNSSSITITASDSTNIPITNTNQVLPTRYQWTFDRLGKTNLSIAIRGPNYTNNAVFRVAVLSDIQNAIDKVQDIYSKINSDTTIQYVISSGDLTSQGTEAEMKGFQLELEKLNVPMYATPGNHDAFAGFRPWQKYFGRGNFQFLFREIYFTFIDTGKASVEKQAYTLLEQWLSNTKTSLSIFLAHIAPFEPSGLRDGAFASKPEALRLLSTLANANTDLTLYGHVHSYYEYSNANIPAYISGGGGAIPQKFDGIGRHFLILDLDPAKQSFIVNRIDVDN